MSGPLFPRRILIATLIAISAALGGCADSPDPTDVPPGTADVIRVGSANFPENRLLAEIYATGLERSLVRVERRFSVGNREAYLPALRNGSIDLVPEYTGNLLLSLDLETTATLPDEIYQQLTTELPTSARVLDAADAQDQDAVVVTRAFAEQNGLKTIDDLRNRGLCQTIAFGGPAEFQDRSYGTAGLASRYGCQFGQFRPLDVSGPLTVAALRAGEVKAANMFSTDPAIARNDFVLLGDPKSNFPAENVVPLIASTKADDPRVTQVLNRISAELDTPTLKTLNEQLTAPGVTPARVAEGWLDSIGI